MGRSRRFREGPLTGHPDRDGKHVAASDPHAGGRRDEAGRAAGAAGDGFARASASVARRGAGAGAHARLRAGRLWQDDGARGLVRDARRGACVGVAGGAGQRSAAVVRAPAGGAGPAVAGGGVAGAAGAAGRLRSGRDGRSVGRRGDRPGARRRRARRRARRLPPRHRAGLPPRRDGAGGCVARWRRDRDGEPNASAHPACAPPRRVGDCGDRPCRPRLQGGGGRRAAERVVAAAAGCRAGRRDPRACRRLACGLVARRLHAAQRVRPQRRHRCAAPLARSHRRIPDGGGAPGAAAEHARLPRPHLDPRSHERLAVRGGARRSRRRRSAGRSAPHEPLPDQPR